MTSADFSLLIEKIDILTEWIENIDYMLYKNLDNFQLIVDNILMITTMIYYLLAVGLAGIILYIYYRVLTWFIEF